MLLRPVSNPPNPWHSTEVEYLEGEPPDAKLEVYEDHTRSILAHNDSPDVGFDWSVNPYRGCFHACAYCASGDTPILMGDGTTKPLRDVRVGDTIYGTEVRGRYRRYKRTQVLDHWSTFKPARRIRLADGTELIASAEHRFLTRRGWKHVMGAECGPFQRPFLTTNDKLLGVGAFAEPPDETDEYKRGYLCGMVRGDALLKSYRYPRPDGSYSQWHQFRLALVDLEPLQRVRGYLDEIAIDTQEFLFQQATATRKEVRAIRASGRRRVEQIRGLCEWPANPTTDWRKGFLAGIFDAEGGYNQGVLRISNTDERIIAEIVRCLASFEFDAVVELPSENYVASNVRVRGGLREQLRFFHTVGIATSRKRDIEGVALKSDANLRVVNVEPLGFSMPMFDITTGTGDFIANGVVSHNCYARPTHEYLGLGAGTDFDRKITVKPRAPELLREAFDKPSWQGELVVFSGVTDCYQPLEASYRLTRGCLEVCADYRNPAHVITKSPLVERDIDVLLRLHRDARVGITVSIPIMDREAAHAIEPYVATPERRLKTIERLAQAGLDVGINVAPLIPGISDDDMGELLERAAAAGARHANYVFLRLPGSVRAVFEERLRKSLPLRADKVLSRVREARGGKLYDSRWGIRGRGQGPLAEAAGALFIKTAKRLGLRAGCKGGEERPPTFRRPDKPGSQMKLW